MPELTLTIPSRFRHAGFSLIELLITVAIVAVLASVALPMTELVVQRGKEQDLHAALRQIREAIDAYKQAVDAGRITKSADESGYPKSLQVLVDGIEDTKDPHRPRIYFLRRLPRDPMARDSTVQPAETWGKRSYASSASDPQEGSDVFDVYSLSPGIGLNGIPYRDW